MAHDVVIIGGGPAGLAAALTLGRARKRVLFFDAGSPRNSAATHIHNFVTRDGVPPAEFRAIAREQLARYDSVEVRESRVDSILGESGAFFIEADSEEFHAHRVILCTGMVDEMLPIPGFAELWGHSIFQCPYCHGWEARDGRWGYLALDRNGLSHGFHAMLRGWTSSVQIFTDDRLTLTAEEREYLEGAGFQTHEAKIASLRGDGGALEAVELSDGTVVTCDSLFVHPPQRQVALVQSLELQLDDAGYVVVEPMSRRTSIPGIYAAGDLTTMAQGASFSASMGTQAAGMVNHELSVAQLEATYGPNPFTSADA